MSRGIVRKFDICTGHGCFPNTYPDANAGAKSVMVNNQPVILKGDSINYHCCPDNGCHNGQYIGSYAQVFAENKYVQVQGDPISCGSFCSACSNNVIVG